MNHEVPFPLDGEAALQGRSADGTDKGLVKNGAVPDTDGRPNEKTEITYVPVPPRRSVRVSVRYRVRGRGRPLPYTLPEEEKA